MSIETPVPLLDVMLKKREARRIVAGHPWVFANEIERVDAADRTAGLCRVRDDSKRYVGTGYYNKHSLISVRLLTRDPDEAVDQAFFERRFAAAKTARSRIYPEGEARRWVFGEADGLPGLVVDAYPGLLVIQVATLGMEQLRPLWEPALRAQSQGLRWLLRNDAHGRAREGLPAFVGLPDGPVAHALEFSEAGVPVTGLPLAGQKTGYYLDQRENRIWVRRLAPGADVLDLHSYTGAWGLSLLGHGARRVTFVDQSKAALDAAHGAAVRSGRVSACRFQEADALDHLRRAKAEKSFYDLVVTDPPALIPNRKAFGPGRRSYLNLYTAVLNIVAPGGYAALCSCSYHLKDNDFQELLEEAAGRVRRAVLRLWQGSAGPDHPRPVTFPEADYLKCAIVQVL